MKKEISRRKFVVSTVGAGTGVLILPQLSAIQASGRANPIRPIIISSHSNETGRLAMEAGWEVLRAGGNAVDAVEKAANVIEDDPEDTSVGYGGLPNENGVVQLDASFMDGRTYSAGAVACLENIRHPSSVAKLVMQRTDHVLLVGAGALDFARAWGFPEENLLTDKARKIWLRWKEELSPDDDWGLPEHLQKIKQNESYYQDFPDIEHHYGTTNVLAIDVNGDIAGCTTTSGLSFKLNGRVGDSPIIGAGLYVDNEVGAAGATGRGEDVIKSCASYFMVLRMKEGIPPQKACEEALRMITDKYRKVNPDFYPSEKFVAINKAGEYGCATMKGERNPRMSVMSEKGFLRHEGIVAYPGK
ncbi:MAG: asparaginase [Bacteroidales bacterium]|jgi:N4-(beta-N-acetylglucosaminyl)-L-asparaginase|nr:asparaginase [Bacteroidales bacterium]HPB13612.1 N(4)-(beta-N-acetylglucosaminyl)-L-asparaginase [Bacteroidales bacterium]HPV16967.1 N(4)-(beta-N-acetylglucosaminyl)-L-asparaginase [Bacteroidales bacterium]HPX44189.1 N(4)-(beta-N-acetylglucosaminyl)-L-asparaginase [Bacteroidales bacterium]HQB86834.1 N(4)-(beta-N-acetylglucosaminyl)-L-asparaginase [Bacteroidales bacterium]